MNANDWLSLVIVLICLLLCVAFGLLWRLHAMVLQGML